MTIERLQGKAAELNQLAAQAEGLEKRYAAHLMLHDAACMAGNDAEATQRRAECHDLLDAVLDNSHSVHRVSRELRNIAQG